MSEPNRSKQPLVATTFRIPIGILLGLVLGGCAGLSDPDCEAFSRDAKEIDYETHYRFAEYETQGVHQYYDSLPKPDTAAARLYKIELSDERTPICTHVYIRKDLYLDRGSSKALVLEQIREFYTESGRLIATKRENVTADLARSGYYIATVPLPIPKAAPPGTYRIISKLVVRSRTGAREQILSRATATFEVEPNVQPK
jgi:hypothetical protein